MVKNCSLEFGSLDSFVAIDKVYGQFILILFEIKLVWDTVG